MGLSSSSDKWCRYSDFVIEGCEFAKKIVEDILIWALSLELLESQILKILERCASIKCTILREKFVIGTEISFTGFLISYLGIKPDPKKTIAISSFPSPKTIRDLRSFLGLDNKFAFFLPDFSYLMCEMRKLLSTKNAYLCLDIHNLEFQKPNFNTMLFSDASRLNCLGYALLQQELNGTLLADHVLLLVHKTDMPNLNWNALQLNMASANVAFIYKVYLLSTSSQIINCYSGFFKIHLQS